MCKYESEVLIILIHVAFGLKNLQLILLSTTMRKLFTFRSAASNEGFKLQRIYYGYWLIAAAFLAQFIAMGMPHSRPFYGATDRRARMDPSRVHNP